MKSDYEFEMDEFDLPAEYENDQEFDLFGESENDQEFDLFGESENDQEFDLFGEHESDQEFDLFGEHESDQEFGRFRRAFARPFSPRLNAPRRILARPRRRPVPRRRRRFPAPVRARRFYLSAPESRGAREYVRWLQTMLNQALNLQLPVNGVMSVQTRSAIRSFQEKNSLPATGIVGPDTERALVAPRDGQASGAGVTQPDDSVAPAPSTSPMMPTEPDGATPEPASTTSAGSADGSTAEFYEFDQAESLDETDSEWFEADDEDSGEAPFTMFGSPERESWLEEAEPARSLALTNLAEQIAARHSVRQSEFEYENSRPARRWSRCFQNADIERVRKTYQDNAVAASANDIDRCSCIVMLNVALGQLLKLRTKQSRARSKSNRRVQMGALTTETIEKAMAQLRNRGYATSPIVIGFFDRRNKTAGTLKPERLKKSVQKAVLDKSIGKGCWYAYGISVMDGYHSVLLLVDTTGSDTKIYWLDQFSPDVSDEVTTTLDNRLTTMTQQYWQHVMTQKKIGSNTPVRVWPLGRMI